MDGVNGPYNYFHGDRKVVVSRVEDSRGKRFPQQGWSLEDDNGRQRWVETDAKNFHALYCGGEQEDWLLNLPDRSTIFIVEGEKDVINMRMAGMAAVSAIGGAERAWKKSYCEYLVGHRVHIIVDHDKPGFKFGRSAYDCLVACGVSVDGVWRTDSEFGSKEDVSNVLESDVWSDGDGNLRELLLDLLVPCLEELPGGPSGAAGESKGQAGGRAKRALRLVSDGEDVDWLNKALEHMREEDSGRHDTMLWLACQLRDSLIETGEMCMVDGDEEKEAIGWFDRFQKEVDDPDDPFVYEEELKKFREIFQDVARPGWGEQDDEDRVPVPSWAGEGLFFPDNFSEESGTLVKRTGIVAPWIPLCSKLPIITAIADKEEDKEWFELKWQVAGKTKRVVESTHKISSATSILFLSEYGLGVTSENSADMVRFFRRFIDLNEEQLRESGGNQVIEYIGYNPGYGWYGGGTVEKAIIDPKVSRLSRSLHTAGSFAGWQEVMEEFWCDDLALVLCASLAAPLLEVIGCSPFTFDISGESSIGKSGLLKAAASVWGSPLASADGGMMDSWQDTEVAIMRKGEVIRGIPMFREDSSQTGGHPEKVIATIRAVAEGQGKSIGTRTGGWVEGKPWRSILIMSGEESAVGMTEHLGTRARTISVVAPKIVRPDGEAMTLHKFKRLNEFGVDLHYGWLGSRLIEYIKSRSKSYWKGEYHRHIGPLSSWAERIKASKVEQRKLQYVAALETPAQFLGLVLGDYARRDLLFRDRTLKEIICGGGLESGENDPVLGSLQRIYSAASSQRWARFYSYQREEDGVVRWVPPGNQNQPALGRWDRKFGSKLSFYPGSLERMCKDLEIPFKVLKSSWANKGYLIRKVGQQDRVQFAPKGAVEQAYSFRADLFVDLGIEFEGDAEKG